MKTLFVLLSTTILFGCIQRGSNDHKSKEETAITAVIDITDPQKLKLWPKAEPILRLYNCATSPEQACMFNIEVITDVSINKTYRAYLPPESETDKFNTADDIQFRDKCIIRFYDSTKRLLTRFYNETDTTKERGYSECWATIARSLQHLGSITATTKFLIIYSDLAENSGVTVYKKGKNLASKTIKDKLEEKQPVPHNIKGISVIIVYQPVDRSDDARFQLMLQIYRLLLEPHGVRVIHQATNESFDL